MNIHIEYCIKWNYGPEFDRVSNIINSLKKNVTISCNKSAPRSGAFEVEINGRIVFSKFKNGGFPDKTDVLSWF